MTSARGLPGHDTVSMVRVLEPWLITPLQARAHMHLNAMPGWQALQVRPWDAIRT